ncbi:MAG: hypothetical protein HZB99_00345 [Candidatus Harrisonbacteria bacterium]|nr:hypothetical protein [Candidatus Harrisonbacteria bacterium]
MENYLIIVSLTLVGIVLFLMLASPTIRRDIINYFDLGSKKTGNQEDEFEAALKRVAMGIGMTTEEFKGKLEDKALELAFIKDCLTLKELKQWPNLSDIRMLHVEQCKTCRAMLEVVGANNEKNG